ncbi:MAG: ImmA/IrrE family metallo-endopeptidase [Actinomycetota bacterium]|nr:ImmA/IrrE family metallo-endopeptidase [Actinomycetota bacterium]
MSIAYDPYAAAAGMGLSVFEANLPNRHLGEYWHDHRMILIVPGLTYRETRSVLTHEVAHAIAADYITLSGPIRRTQELRARRVTARLLIDPEEFADSCKLRDGHVSTIAHDLDVIPQVVADWIAMQKPDARGLGERSA